MQHHADLGLAGIHMYYATAADHTLPTAHGRGITPHHGVVGQAPGIEHHRLLHWKLVRGVPFTPGDPYARRSRRLARDDCAFRWRHAYAFIVFLERSEFLHFPGQAPPPGTPALLCCSHAGPHLSWGQGQQYSVHLSYES